MKRSLVSLVTLITPTALFTPIAIPSILASLLFTPQSHAQEPTLSVIQGLSALGGYAIGSAFKKDFAQAPALGAGALPILTTFGYEAYKNKNDEEKIKYYLAGRNYERWIRAQNLWYQSTLDPTTGRPPAFSGLNAMDIGLPTPPPSAYSAPSSFPNLQNVYSQPVKVPAGTYDGIPKPEHYRTFPKLP